MWPKALAQLIELAPHIGRLLPMADRFFQSKTASEDAARNAMEQMAEGLRGDLGQVTASHAGLYRQLNDQSEKLNNIAAEQRSTTAAVAAIDTRIAGLEKTLRSLLILVVVLAVTSLTALAIILVIVTHHG